MFPHHIETSQLICIANQLTGFNMLGNIGRNFTWFILEYLVPFMLNLKICLLVREYVESYYWIC